MIFSSKRRSPSRFLPTFAVRPDCRARALEMVSRSQSRYSPIFLKAVRVFLPLPNFRSPFCKSLWFDLLANFPPMQATVPTKTVRVFSKSKMRLTALLCIPNPSSSLSYFLLYHGHSSLALFLGETVHAVPGLSGTRRRIFFKRFAPTDVDLGRGRLSIRHSF